MTLALAAFVFLGLFSPGPNVIMLTASGAKFGFRATIPHILGVALGVGFTAAATGFGVGTLLKTFPAAKFGLQILACAWILWMAYNLYRTGSLSSRNADRPFTFLQAVLFQWVNPKVWSICIAATAYVTLLNIPAQAATLGFTFSTINLGVCLFWTFAGNLLARLMTSTRAWKLFRTVMAIGLALSGFLVFLG